MKPTIPLLITFWTQLLRSQSKLRVLGPGIRKKSKKVSSQESESSSLRFVSAPSCETQKEIKSRQQMKKKKGNKRAAKMGVGDLAVRVGGINRLPDDAKPLVKDTDRYETPKEFFDYWNEIFQFNLDVCAEEGTAKLSEYYDLSDDALRAQWWMRNPEGEQTRAWCNPPYSRPLPWIDKAKYEQERGVFTCMLLPGDISPKWYLALNAPGIVKIPLTGRLAFKFKGKSMDGSKFGNIIALFFPLTGEGKRLP